MAIYKIEDKDTIRQLFEDWEETMIWSCLDDCMGTAYADNLKTPTAAQIILGPLSFFAGKANEELLRNHFNYSVTLVPQNEKWSKEIERIYGARVVRNVRYATKKLGNTFDTDKLWAYTKKLPENYRLKKIDDELCHTILVSDWAYDLCANYGDAEHFMKDGLGFVVTKEDGTKNGEIVSGAASFSHYNHGIEIEIDTREDERGKGFATACGAALILECMKRNLYPSWDAYDKRSLTLAGKLGYQFDEEYPVYDFV